MGKVTDIVAFLTLTVFISLNKSAVECYEQPRNSKEPHFNLKTLRFVSVIARHGSRADFESFPNDPCPPENITCWPYGPGALTKVGRQQTYELGQNLRQRYGGFISELYTRKEAVFQSNLNSRDLMSAEMIAAGMYPPVGFEIWNETRPNWQPIEVWPIAFDVVEVKRKCPAFVRLMTSACGEASDELYKENKDFIDSMVHLTGHKLETVKRNPKSVFDPIFFSKQNGLPVPDWVDDKILETLSVLSSKMFLIESFGSPKQIQLTSGPVVRTLLEQLGNVTTAKIKFIMLAGHDTTIVAVKFAYGIFEYSNPDPASYLAVELHSDGNDSFVQMVFFNDSKTTVPTMFEIPECPHPCQLDQFAQIGKRVLLDNWEDECQGSNTSSALTVSTFIIFVITIFALFCTLF